MQPPNELGTLPALWAVRSLSKIVFPKQTRRNPVVPGMRVVYIEPSSTALEETKKEMAVILLLRKLTV